VVVLHHQKAAVEESLQQAVAGQFQNLQFVDQGTPKGTGHASAGRDASARRTSPATCS
jgi:bifunctional N-acetylglucosamine-1-phosphate-uridyltransferase/glucosamine-1-phosphate-acetyltransferase GlmU-like protein